MTSDSVSDTWHCNATWHWQCHVSHTETWHVAFFFSNWHVACWLTASVNYIWKGPNWNTFSKVEMQLTLFLNRVLIWLTSPKLGTIQVIIPLNNYFLLYFALQSFEKLYYVSRFLLLGCFISMIFPFNQYIWMTVRINSNILSICYSILL